MAKESLDERELALPGSLSCWAHYSPCKGTGRQERPASTITELGTAAGSRERSHMRGDSRFWEVRMGWRQGQAQLSFPLLLSSRKLAKPALPVLSPSLPRGFAYAAEQAGASFVFFGSWEDTSCCPRIKFENTWLLKWEFCLLVDIVWSNAGQNRLERLAVLTVKQVIQYCQDRWATSGNSGVNCN